jgi:hypothetical protein
MAFSPRRSAMYVKTLVPAGTDAPAAPESDLTTVHRAARGVAGAFLLKDVFDPKSKYKSVKATFGVYLLIKAVS